jgi:hypothetical protein
MSLRLTTFFPVGGRFVPAEVARGASTFDRVRPQITFIRGERRGEKNRGTWPVGVAVGLPHEGVADERDVDLCLFHLRPIFCNASGGQPVHSSTMTFPCIADPRRPSYSTRNRRRQVAEAVEEGHAVRELRFGALWPGDVVEDAARCSGAQSRKRLSKRSSHS